jgi:hypothetical protein
VAYREGPFLDKADIPADRREGQFVTQSRWGGWLPLPASECQSVEAIKQPRAKGVTRYVMLLVGFPIALPFAWIQQLGPTSGAAPSAATTKLDYGLAGALSVMIALVPYQQLTPSRTARSAQQQASLTPAFRRRGKLV